MRRSIILATVLIATLVLAGCAPGPNSLEKTADADGKTAGFLMGLWQGLHLAGHVHRLDLQQERPPL